MKLIGILCLWGMLATAAALRTASAGGAQGSRPEVKGRSVKQRPGLLKQQPTKSQGNGRVPALGHFVMGGKSQPSKKAGSVKQRSNQNHKTIKQRNLRRERRLNDGHGAHGGHPAPSHSAPSHSAPSHKAGHKPEAEVEEEYDLPEESVMKARINYPDLGLVNLEKGTYLFKIT